MDVVKQGRFSSEGHLTVQQLYNNLASNFSVSEIYAVVDGFDRKKNDVPFFMYDQLIVKKRGDTVKDEAVRHQEIAQFESREFAVIRGAPQHLPVQCQTGETILMRIGVAV